MTALPVNDYHAGYWAQRPWLGNNAREIAKLLGTANDLLQTISDLMPGFIPEGMGGLHNRPGITYGGCFPPVSRPVPIDCCHPAGSLRTSGNAVTTAGGYRVEMLGQFEWKITGPDGKSTRIWGDPHVDEGDGGKWDFKRNSTFVLGDGTRINVTTAPWGSSGMTVTSGLEIISGNDRVEVRGIDRGIGQIGPVTHDGFSRVNGFLGDAFVMGRETDDWSFQGKEIIGSNNGGDSFNLGNFLPPLARQLPATRDWMRWPDHLFNRFQRQIPINYRPYNSYYQDLRYNRPRRYERAERLHAIDQSFRRLGRMFYALSNIFNLSAQVESRFNSQLRMA